MANLPTSVREQFPILQRKVNGKPLVYLDSAATTQKPLAVIEAIVRYYSEFNSNVHRGVHQLSQEATEAFEGVRIQLQQHLHAAEAHEIIFTKGTTDSINTVAHGFRSILQPGDEIIVTQLEHHSNLVPWQMLAQHTGATLRYVPMDGRGVLDMKAYADLLSPSTKVVAFNHISNALGTVNPVKEMTVMAHQYGAAVVVDGAQALPHTTVDVQDLDVDFYAGSAHKMYGPTGIGLLYGKTTWLEKLPQYQGGGEMIAEVAMEVSTYAGLPHKFEAGTPNIEAVIGWGAALTWMNRVGVKNIQAHEDALLRYATERLEAIPGVKIYGKAPEKAAVISFNVHGLHPYDVGTLLDQMGIAVRTGQHCTQPIMDEFGIPGTIRASLAAYTTKEDLDALVKGLEKAISLLQ